MNSSDAMSAWFDEQLNSLPADAYSVETLYELFEDPPMGITTIKFEYKSIPLVRSGPKGWTYFPSDTEGSRLARVSYTSLVPGVTVTALVKLFKKPDSPPETDSYYITKRGHAYAIITIDNFTGHGHVEYRQSHPAYKRRKVSICH